MAKKDGYITSLGDIVLKVEDVYGMRRIIDNKKLLDYPIADVIKILSTEISKTPREKIDELNASSGKVLILLSYLTSRMRYFNKKRLDFSKYPNMRTVTKILINFTKRDRINEKSLRDINKIITLLVEIDRKYVNFHNALAYRFLRMFVILVMYGNYSNASVVADFILNQIVTREDLQ